MRIEGATTDAREAKTATMDNNMIKGSRLYMVFKL